MTGVQTCALPISSNLKLILSAFEQLSGLQINFHNSELFCFGDAQEAAVQYAVLFGCAQRQFPIRYLGIPIHYRRLTKAEWKHVEERLQAPSTLIAALSLPIVFFLAPR